MNDHDNTFEELCAGYVLNALSTEEEQEFMNLLADASAEQRELLYDMEAVSAEMASLAREVEPSAYIKQKLMMEIRKGGSSGTSSTDIRDLSKFRYAVAASFIFIFVSIGLLFYSQTLRGDLQEQADVIQRQKTTITELKSEVEKKEELLNILAAREVDLVMMDGLDVNPSGYGKVVWDKENGEAILQVANMPAVPVDKDYQLWFIVDGQPQSAGVFAVQEQSRDNFFKIEQLQSSATAGAFAITLEPKGGVPQPTGDMYMLGNMSSD